METKTVERIRELQKKTTNEQCIHHWVIDGFNVGRCIKCPAVRDFGALLKKQGTDIVQARVQSGKRGRKGKNRGTRKS